MAKTDTPRGRSRRQSKRLNPEVVEDNASSEDQAKEDHKDIQKDAEGKADIEDDQSEIGPANVETEDQAKDEPEDVRTVVDDKAETEDTETRCQTSDHEEPLDTTPTHTPPEVPLEEETKDIKDEGDVETDTVIEVKGSAPTVSVSWEKDERPEEPETVADDLTRPQDTAISKDEQVEMTTDIQEEEEMEAGAGEEEKTQTTEVVLVEESEEEPAEAEEKDDEIEIIEDKETEEAEDKDDVEMESFANEDDVCEKTVQEGESDREEENKEATAKVNGKRKAESLIDSSPSKKVRVINDGYCLYVGNLDSSKYYKEIRSALENYFITQSVLVQDIRLDKAKKHAFIDLVSEIDLTKALKLNGQKLLDKPLKIAKAIVKEVDLVKKKKDPQEVQKSKNERTIHVENIPSTATKQDVLKVFPKATAVRFLREMENPTKGVAFVEFQSKDQADAARAQSGTVMMKDCVLRVNVVRQSSGVHKTKSDSKNITKDEAPPSNTLFVSNLPLKVQTRDLKKIFKNAVQINIPQSEGKSRGYAFVEFESVAHAQKALKASKNGVISKRPFKVQFGFKSHTEQARVPSKTLIVLGLHEKTTVKTLTDAFEGALSSRIFVNKDTGQSRKFGFVDFESADSCAWAKEAAEDVQIDGRKVTVAFARPKHSQCPDTGEREEHIGGKKGKGRKAGQSPLKKPKVAHQD